MRNIKLEQYEDSINVGYLVVCICDLSFPVLRHEVLYILYPWREQCVRCLSTRWYRRFSSNSHSLGLVNPRLSPHMGTFLGYILTFHEYDRTQTWQENRSPRQDYT